LFVKRESEQNLFPVVFELTFDGASGYLRLLILAVFLDEGRPFSFGEQSSLFSSPKSVFSFSDVLVHAPA